MSQEETVRLSCPTCDAVYEVPAGALPADGRDVQCSNCGTVWFQKSGEPPAPPSAAALDPAGEAGRKGDADARRPPLSEEGRRILVEEAERERSLRAGHRPPPDGPGGAAAAVDSILGDDGGHPSLTRPVPNDRVAGRTPAHRGAERPAASIPAAGAVGKEDGATPGDAVARPSRRDRFPDIAEIDPHLAPRDPGASDDGPAGTASGQGSGFRLGFALALLVAAALLVLYVQAERIGDTAPALAPALGAYRDGVNDIRIGLDGLARSAAEALEE